MISLTTYWQQFKKCIDIMNLENASEYFLKQFRIINGLIQVGLTIEQLGITEIQGVGTQLADIAKEFNHEVSIQSPERTLSFYLPQITDTNGLILAISYYQHLNNYKNVQYEGTIRLFRGRVEKGIEEKKERTSFQALAMLNEIRDYCKKNNIKLDESELLRKPQETELDYMTRIIKSYTPKPKEVQGVVEEKAPPKVEKKDDVQKLEDCLAILKGKETELQLKIDSLAKKLMEYRQSSHNYLELNQQWSEKSPFSRFFIWLISWFRKDTFIHQLSQAQAKYDETSMTLNNEFQPYRSAEDYQTSLKIQLAVTHSDCEDTKKQIANLTLERYKLEIKEEMLSKVATVQEAPIANKLAPSFERPPMKATSFQHPNYYRMFTDYAPSKQTMSAIAVAAAAVVYESYRANL